MGGAARQKLEDELPPEDEQLEDIEASEDPASPAAPKVVDLDEADEEDRIARLDQTEKNKAFAAMRKEAADAKRERDDLKKRMAEYEERMKTPAPVYTPPPTTGVQREYIGGVPVPQNKQEWDALARQDWQTAVDLKAVIKTREIQNEMRTQDKHSSVLEDTKQKVLAKHPELNDPNSEKSRMFMQVLDQNPEYLRLPKGPMYAMREMEENMLANGYTHEQLFDNKKVLARNEATRVARGALTGGGRMPEKSGRTVQLSKDDLEFCQAQGIDPKDYARERLELDAKKKGAQL